MFSKIIVVKRGETSQSAGILFVMGLLLALVGVGFVYVNNTYSALGAVVVLGAELAPNGGWIPEVVQMGTLSLGLAYVAAYATTLIQVVWLIPASTGEPISIGRVGLVVLSVAWMSGMIWDIGTTWYYLSGLPEGDLASYSFAAFITLLIFGPMAEVWLMYGINLMVVNWSLGRRGLQNFFRGLEIDLSNTTDGGGQRSGQPRPPKRHQGHSNPQRPQAPRNHPQSGPGVGGDGLDALLDDLFPSEKGEGRSPAPASALSSKKRRQPRGRKR